MSAPSQFGKAARCIWNVFRVVRTAQKAKAAAERLLTQAVRTPAEAGAQAYVKSLSQAISQAMPREDCRVPVALEGHLRQMQHDAIN